MKILHFGYSELGSTQYAFEKMQESNILLVDIRYSTKSIKKPYWSQENLRHLYKEKYIYIHSLGNKNYFRRELPIEIVNLKKGIRILLSILEEGKTPLLMCTCQDYETCHRKIVINAALQIYSGIQVKGMQEDATDNNANKSF